MDEIHWHLSYQGCGFCFACDPSCSQEIIDIFAGAGCSGAVVGTVDDSMQMKLTDGESTEVLFDFEKDIITGVKVVPRD